MRTHFDKIGSSYKTQVDDEGLRDSAAFPNGYQFRKDTEVSPSKIKLKKEAICYDESSATNKR